MRGLGKGISGSKGHDIEALADDANLQRSAEERAVLQYLSSASVNEGRYPCASNATRKVTSTEGSGTQASGGACFVGQPGETRPEEPLSYEKCFRDFDAAAPGRAPLQTTDSTAPNYVPPKCPCAKFVDARAGIEADAAADATTD